MQFKANQYYLYDDQSSDESSNEMVVVEENKLLTQLEEAVVYSKDQHSEDELSAAVGMMLMHYQAIDVSDSENKFAAKIRQEKQAALKPKHTITKTQPSHNTRLDAIRQQIHKNRKSNYGKSSLLASCRNILKEFLSQNSL